MGSVPPAYCKIDMSVSRVSLTAARDLLQSHLPLPAADPASALSPWATAVRSAVIGRAQIAEIAVVARHAAVVGTAVADTPWRKAERAGDACQAVRTASQCLLELHGVIEVARRREPVLATEASLLRAMPVNRTPPRPS